MRDTRAALIELKNYGKDLSKQQYKTIKGQILAGDVTGAMKGLDAVLKRKGL